MIKFREKFFSYEENLALDKLLDQRLFSFLNKFNSSLPLFDKYDLMKIFVKGGTILVNKSGIRVNTKEYIMDSLLTSMIPSKMPFFGKKLQRKDLNNFCLEKCFKDLGYIEGFDYTVKNNSTSSVNLYLSEGHLIICSGLVGRSLKKFEEKILKNYKFVVTDIKGSVTLYTYVVETIKGLENLVRDIVNLNIKPNIYSR